MTDAPRPPRRHPTKIDWWLGALLVLAPVIVVGSAVALTLAGEPGGAIVEGDVLVGRAAHPL